MGYYNYQTEMELEQNAEFEYYMEMVYQYEEYEEYKSKYNIITGVMLDK